MYSYLYPEKSGKRWIMNNIKEQKKDKQNSKTNGNKKMGG